ncbi:TIGR02757 family protein [Vampirovibrio chlorellavorus]|uniref:TIGR02757 family protein n=1 Tax=Vampirovibrio chlorellavorus TaxID=758823 RepID=UPI0026F30FFB|nr:TIGR02757 family protein [Vampirovibrio chlorellavorus]
MTKKQPPKAPPKAVQKTGTKTSKPKGKAHATRPAKARFSGLATPKSPAGWQALAPALDALVSQYKVPSYIDSDPIQIPYRYVDNPKACELVAFITALFSYGRRDFIIETINGLFQITENDPVGFMESFNRQRDAKLFQHFIYRFNKGPDVAFLWERLQWVYTTYGSLEALFQEAVERGLKADPSVTRLKAGITGVNDALLNHQEPNSYGLKFLFAHPGKGGACKRFNMFLRWMVRQDEEPGGKVDFGLWKKALHPADLLIPLDTHVMKMNRKLGLSPRHDGSWRTAEEITAVFRQLCPQDPVKYDYALFGFSLDKRASEELLALAGNHKAPKS